MLYIVVKSVNVAARPAKFGGLSALNLLLISIPHRARMPDGPTKARKCRFIPFPRGVNAAVQVEFELAYDVTVQHISHNAMGTSLEKIRNGLYWGIRGVMVTVVGKWTGRHKFKTRARLFAFHIALILYRKACLQLSSLHLRVKWGL